MSLDVTTRCNHTLNTSDFNFLTHFFECLDRSEELRQDYYEDLLSSKYVPTSPSYKKSAFLCQSIHDKSVSNHKSGVKDKPHQDGFPSLQCSASNSDPSSTLRRRYLISIHSSQEEEKEDNEPTSEELRRYWTVVGGAINPIAHHLSDLSCHGLQERRNEAHELDRRQRNVQPLHQQDEQSGEEVKGAEYTRRRCQVPNTTTAQTVVPTDQPRRTRRVSFSNIEIRTYERILGDNPSCSSGPPVSIGWRHTQTRNLDVDEYESSRVHEGITAKKAKKSMVLHRKERERMLLEMGYSKSDLTQAVRRNLQVQRERRMTVLNLDLSLIEECLERVGRGVERLMGLRGERSKALYEEWLRSSGGRGLEVR